MKTKSSVSVLFLATLLSAMLSGCAIGSSAPKGSLQIYQPRALFLEAGQPIQSKAGTYVPQVDETWHSAASYSDLESQLINTAAALAQERNRSR
ncbi:MAG: hypothetical protein K0R17_2254 [Rariglobus sp.]|jgi:hypothetical protein|nr:hypothetical protein [Microvirga sp.]MDF3058039.1 hypothetical protein [Rariglobus sp.]